MYVCVHKINDIEALVPRMYIERVATYKSDFTLASTLYVHFHVFTNKGMLKYFVSCKMIRRHPAVKPMHLIVYTNLLYLYTTRVLWQTKCKLMICITRVSCAFTGNRLQVKIACNSE